MSLTESSMSRVLILLGKWAHRSAAIISCVESAGRSFFGLIVEDKLARSLDG